MTKAHSDRSAGMPPLKAGAGAALGAAIVVICLLGWRQWIGRPPGEVATGPGDENGVAAFTVPDGTALAPPVDQSPGAQARLAPDPVSELRARHLRIPLDEVKPRDLRDSFRDARDKTRPHEALDILAPRNTPVHAVEGGTVAKLFLSKAGGLTIYQFDPFERYAYYYAHLDHYAEGLREHDHVSRGQVIGFVGTSGNAPPDTPHLHFAIFLLTPAHHWWQGTAVNPYDVFR